MDENPSKSYTARIALTILSGISLVGGLFLVKPKTEKPLATPVPVLPQPAIVEKKDPFENIVINTISYARYEGLNEEEKSKLLSTCKELYAMLYKFNSTIADNIISENDKADYTQKLDAYLTTISTISPKLNMINAQELKSSLIDLANLQVAQDTNEKFRLKLKEMDSLNR